MSSVAIPQSLKNLAKLHYLANTASNEKKRVADGVRKDLLKEMYELGD